MSDIGADCIGLAKTIERTHGDTNPPYVSSDQIRLIVETLSKAGNEIVRLRASIATLPYGGPPGKNGCPLGCDAHCPEACEREPHCNPVRSGG